MHCIDKYIHNYGAFSCSLYTLLIISRNTIIFIPRINNIDGNSSSNDYANKNRARYRAIASCAHTRKERASGVTIFVPEHA